MNAANSGMIGCYQPYHNCIDNCIHTYAGVQLRNTCTEIMARQGYEEPAWQAKITPAYNLPCKYVIHTVGPIVQGRLIKQHEELLDSCYRSCLELTEKNWCKSIAFCCISTVFSVSRRNGRRRSPCRRCGNTGQKHTAISRWFSMFSSMLIMKSTRTYSKNIKKLKEVLADTDSVVIGAGAGLSTSAGFVYSGERFDKYFSDFAAKYRFMDMYSGGFYPYASLEEFWRIGAGIFGSTAIWTRPSRFMKNYTGL
ncbi:MAG: macro domain-containing protein [Synergistes jonesii]|uniref:macro domain-containing protein n=1 Tax=Synergistes jonesii TaxID=2754 RepID=UPI002A760B62|nr:macro domain-containing protein [Synergistes jonesii]MDY2984769.1 macro domain-containing protein [Synergistes jonesii]